MKNQNKKRNLNRQGLLAALLVFAFVLSGCGAAPAAQTAEPSVSSAAVSSAQSEASVQSAETSGAAVSSAGVDDAEEDGEVTVEQGRETAIEYAQKYLEEAKDTVSPSFLKMYLYGLSAAYEFGVELSGEDIDYVMENCGVDWKEQALKMAEEYLERHRDLYENADSLLSRLTQFDGFTEEEAAYAVENCGLK